ncbi:hypothetical protein KAR91_55600 [Candidatus Pacearchaeota archaeon]|nr:hypothetical protein [Candidatus Pacearchaeota archaeon]
MTKNDKPEKLRFYHAYDSSGNHLCGVVAKTAVEAKKYVHGSDYDEDTPWIELSVKWSKGADTSGFSKGIMNENGDCLLAIKRGLFTGQGEDCELCEDYPECTKFLNNN